MILLLMSLLFAWTPLAQEAKDIPFDIRANQRLLMGHGVTTGRPYYDVVITRHGPIITPMSPPGSKP